jgi:general secretion pathway protein J
MRNRNRAAGFTLLEIMLAIAIMGFISALLWGSFSRTANIKKRTEASEDRLHSARVAMMRITREIEMAYTSNSFNIALADRRTMFVGSAHGDFDELRFSWFGHQRLRVDAAESDTSLVDYYVQTDPENRSAMNLMRRETRRLEQKDPTTIASESYILCGGVTRLKFQFYDYLKKDWKPEWNTMGADGVAYLPTHVRVTLGLLDENGKEMVFTSAARVHMTEKVDHRPAAQ